MPRSLAIGSALSCVVVLTACQQTPPPEHGQHPEPAAVIQLDPKQVEDGAETKATVTADGVVRIAWARTDVAVKVDGMPLRPSAGLGSWAAFKASGRGAMVMGDTVVFEDEVDAAMDAAFAGGLEVTALHNHFFFDEPKVYFMHVGGQGEPGQLAAAVKGVWDAIKRVRADNPNPAGRFGGAIPKPGGLDRGPIEKILGHKATVRDGVVKVNIGREGNMQGTTVGGSMGLGTWAAFSGTDGLAAVDGDFIMTADEVQPVLRALRGAGIHVVALHNHMIGEDPLFYFTHYWGTGPAEELAHAIRSVLDAQQDAAAPLAWNFERDAAGNSAEGWKVETTNPKGPDATWNIIADSDAPSGQKVLTLTSPNHDFGGAYNLCWRDEVRFKDGTLEVLVRANTGDEDQGGGPIWRVQDKNNYYIARYNPLENNFRLYEVKDGARKMLASAPRLKIRAGEWFTIRIVHNGSQIEAWLNGKKLLEVTDVTLTQAGGVGLWTKADAVTSFDDFSVAFTDQ